MSGGEGFWDFSLRVYGAPGVADWCLLLQDRYGADVNLLLWCAWAGSRGMLLGTQDIIAAEAATSAWREQVVRPLRAARLALKGDMGAISAEMAVALRTRVKAVELEAERLQQTALGVLLDARGIGPAGPSGPPRQAVAANLEAYLEHLEVPPGNISAALERAAVGAA